MTKLKFLLSLHERLRDFPQDEVEERLGFYSEMIEDRVLGRRSQPRSHRNFLPVSLQMLRFQ